jgi:hypothetical protein
MDVPHRQAYFAIEFAALDYTAPHKNNYAFRLEGLDREWIYTDSQNRLASYTFLPSGSYRFHVRGSNNDGIGTKPEDTFDCGAAAFLSDLWFRCW